MNKLLSKRLDDLEKTIQSSADLPLWIDGKNSTVKLDIVNHGEEVTTFDTVYETRRWLEQQIAKHPAGGIICYQVDNLADLCDGADELRSIISTILPDHELSGTLALRRIPPGGQANLLLWCLAGALAEYFGTPQFSERWNTKRFTALDDCMMTALFAVYAWDTAEDDLFGSWARLFYQVTKLPG